MKESLNKRGVGGGGVRDKSSQLESWQMKTRAGGLLGDGSADDGVREEAMITNFLHPPPDCSRPAES